MESDIHYYAMTAHEMLKGRLLYTDLWVNRPPAIFMIYALGEKIAGYGPLEFYLLWLLATGVTLVAVYFAGRAFGEVGGLWAAIFLAVSCTDLMLEANAPNAEVFVIALQASAFALAVGGPKPLSLFRCAWIGLLGGLSACMKHPMLVFPVLLALGSGLALRKNRKWELDFKRLTLFIAPSLLFWALTFTYFGINHRFQDCWNALVVYDSYMAGGIWGNLAKGFTHGYLWPKDLRWIFWPLVILAIPAAWRSYQGNPSPWNILAVFGIAVWVETNSAGHWFPHYFQLGLPVLIVAGGWGAAWFWRARKAWVWPALALLIILSHEVPYYFLSSEQWSTERYEMLFVDTQRLGNAIDHVLLPGETFYHFGNDIGLYYAARRDPPSGVYCAWFYDEGPLAARMTDRLKKDLDEQKPELVVIDQLAYPDKVAWFEGDYKPWKNFPEDGQFLVMVRKGGELEKRIQSNPRLTL
jgi:hypothetical protein